MHNIAEMTGGKVVSGVRRVSRGRGHCAGGRGTPAEVGQQEGRVLVSVNCGGYALFPVLLAALAFAFFC